MSGWFSRNKNNGVSNVMVPTPDKLILYNRTVLDNYLSKGFMSVLHASTERDAKEALIDALYFRNGENIQIEELMRSKVYALVLSTHSSAPRIYGKIHAVEFDGKKEYYFFAMKGENEHPGNEDAGRNKLNNIIESVDKMFNSISDKNEVVKKCRSISASERKLKEAEDALWDAEANLNKASQIDNVVHDINTNTALAEKSAVCAQKQKEKERAEYELQRLVNKDAGMWRPLDFELGQRFEEFVRIKQKEEKEKLNQIKTEQEDIEIAESLLKETQISTGEKLDECIENCGLSEDAQRKLRSRNFVKNLVKVLAWGAVAIGLFLSQCRRRGKINQESNENKDETPVRIELHRLKKSPPKDTKEEMKKQKEEEKKTKRNLSSILRDLETPSDIRRKKQNFKSRRFKEWLQSRQKRNGKQ